MNLKKALKQTLDEGEAAAIVLALEQKADLILMDDYDGRAMARGYNLRVMGTTGILLKAKFEGRAHALINQKSHLNGLSLDGNKGGILKGLGGKEETGIDIVLHQAGILHHDLLHGGAMGQ